MTCDPQRARVAPAVGLVLVAVEQRVGARAQLVDARLVRQVARRRRAARDAVAGEPRGDERVARLAQERVDRGQLLADRLAVAVAVARVAADARHLDGRQLRRAPAPSSTRRRPSSARPCGAGRRPARPAATPARRAGAAPPTRPSAAATLSTATVRSSPSAARRASRSHLSGCERRVVQRAAAARRPRGRPPPRRSSRPSGRRRRARSAAAPISGDLCVFVCGQSAMPCSSA